MKNRYFVWITLLLLLAVLGAGVYSLNKREENESKVREIVEPVTTEPGSSDVVDPERQVDLYEVMGVERVPTEVPVEE